jgi:hypothetical protein
MLRDVPRIYLMIFGFVAVIFLLVFWYKETFYRDSDVLQLNEIILTNAVTEVDQASRLYNYKDGSVYMLSDTFELAVWDRLERVYPKGSEVMFAYTFDSNDTRFDNVEDGAESDIYEIGTENKPNPDNLHYMTGRPITNTRLRIREVGEKLADWTYVSSVAVDRVNEFQGD